MRFLIRSILDTINGNNEDFSLHLLKGVPRMFYFFLSTVEGCTSKTRIIDKFWRSYYLSQKALGFTLQYTPDWRLVE